jgi:hypothetical protein
MSEVRAGLLKVRRWKMLADVVDRGHLMAGLLGLVAVAMVHFMANGISGVFAALVTTIRSVF